MHYESIPVRCSRVRSPCFLQTMSLAVILCLVPFGCAFSPVHCRLMPVFCGYAPLVSSVSGSLLGVQPGGLSLVHRLFGPTEGQVSQPHGR